MYLNEFENLQESFLFYRNNIYIILGNFMYPVQFKYQATMTLIIKINNRTNNQVEYERRVQILNEADNVKSKPNFERKINY